MQKSREETQRILSEHNKQQNVLRRRIEEHRDVGRVAENHLVGYMRILPSQHPHEQPGHLNNKPGIETAAAAADNNNNKEEVWNDDDVWNQAAPEWSSDKENDVVFDTNTQPDHPIQFNPSKSSSQQPTTEVDNLPYSSSRQQHHHHHHHHPIFLCQLN